MPNLSPKNLELYKKLDFIKPVLGESEAYSDIPEGTMCVDRFLSQKPAFQSITDNAAYKNKALLIGKIIAPSTLTKEESKIWEWRALQVLHTLIDDGFAIYTYKLNSGDFFRTNHLTICSVLPYHEEHIYYILNETSRARFVQCQSLAYDDVAIINRKKIETLMQDLTMLGPKVLYQSDLIYTRLTSEHVSCLPEFSSIKRYMENTLLDIKVDPDNRLASLSEHVSASETLDALMKSEPITANQEQLYLELFESELPGHQANLLCRLITALSKLTEIRKRLQGESPWVRTAFLQAQPNFEVFHKSRSDLYKEFKIRHLSAGADFVFVSDHFIKIADFMSILKHFILHNEQALFISACNARSSPADFPMISHLSCRDKNTYLELVKLLLDQNDDEWCNLFFQIKANEELFVFDYLFADLEKKKGLIFDKFYDLLKLCMKKKRIDLIEIIFSSFQKKPRLSLPFICAQSNQNLYVSLCQLLADTSALELLHNVLIDRCENFDTLLVLAERDPESYAAVLSLLKKANMPLFKLALHAKSDTGIWAYYRLSEVDQRLFRDYFEQKKISLPSKPLKISLPSKPLALSANGTINLHKNERIVPIHKMNSEQQIKKIDADTKPKNQTFKLNRIFYPLAVIPHPLH